jgi:hypothetical protein
VHRIHEVAPREWVAPTLVLRRFDSSEFHVHPDGSHAPVKVSKLRDQDSYEVSPPPVEVRTAPGEEDDPLAPVHRAVELDICRCSMRRVRVNRTYPRLKDLGLTSTGRRTA